MTDYERNIVKKIYPLACRGQHYAINVLQNLTTKRKRARKCKCGCGEKVTGIAGNPSKSFFTSLCFQRWKRNERMKKLLSAGAALFVASIIFGAELNLGWVNGTNAVPMPTQIHYGTTPGVYSAYITVAPGLTNVTVTNLLAGQRYYFSARHFDPSDGDMSVFSNEANGKTKMNPPKNLNVGQP